VVTHSSGNHGAALALAAKTRGIPAHVVVPEGAVKSKLAAIEAYGAQLYFCAPNMTAREATAAQVQASTGATLVHPFTEPRVIAGQGTAALELASEIGGLAAVITPIGGGGLVGGTAIAIAGSGTGARILAAEPAGADEAWQSLQRGARVTEHAPKTVCDGLRGTLGEINFALLREYDVDILRVADEDTLAAQRLLGERMKIVVEPSSAIVLAAVLRYRERFAGQRIGLIVTGGNVE